MTDDLVDLLVDAAGRSAGGDAASDRTSERLLDAALREAASVGVDRLTVEEVVRRAGVARMTAYRRYPRRDDLVAALVQREVGRFLAAVADGIDGAPTPAEGVAAAFTSAVTFARTHPLLVRASGEPRELLEVITADGGRVLWMGTAFIARYLHGDRPGDPSRETTWVAEAFARLFASFVMIRPTDPAFTDDAALRAYAAAVLTPMAERVV